MPVTHPRPAQPLGYHSVEAQRLAFGRVMPMSEVPSRDALDGVQDSALSRLDLAQFQRILYATFTLVVGGGTLRPSAMGVTIFCIEEN